MDPGEDTRARCPALLERLSDDLGGDLTESLRRWIEAHILECRHCQVCCETLKRTIDRVGGGGEEPSPPGLTRRRQRLLRDLVAP